VPAGKLSVTLRPVAVPPVLLFNVTVKPICEPALTLAASAVLVMATVAGGVGVSVGVGVGVGVSVGVGVGAGVGVGVSVAVGVGVGVGVSVGLGVGVGVGEGGGPAERKAMASSITRTGFPGDIGRLQYAKACSVEVTCTKSFLYCPCCGVASVDSVTPIASNSAIRSGN